MSSGGAETYSMLIVKIDVVHLEVFEGLFTGLPHVFRFSVDSESFSVEESPKFSTDEDLAPEIGVLEQRSQEPLVFSLLSIQGINQSW
jgi:hypothetical protein